MSDILVERRGHILHLVLNRPESLNALNFEILHGIEAGLNQAEHDPEIVAVVIQGAGERAFCSGGDIKAARLGGLAWKAGQAKLEDTLQFFIEEYALNRRMFHFKKPLIALMNGITMGGGVGVAGACRYRVATEKTVWAMPEVSIGFFPDVGAGYYLTGAPGYTGIYLGLTGEHISNPVDLLECGFATHYLSSPDLPHLLSDLNKVTNEDDVLKTISEIAEIPEGERSLDQARIDRYFSKETVEDILQGLEGAHEDWTRSVLAVIKTKSPTSLKITLRHLHLANGDTFDRVSERDLQLAEYCLKGEDLYEGIRAAVVDKDRQPKWKPDKLEDVICPI